MSNSEFFDWLDERSKNRTAHSLETILSQGSSPAQCAVVVVDLVDGFCRTGPLASEAVAALIRPIEQVLVKLHAAGVEHFLFPCDAHPPDSAEFQAFPPHCVEGTQESQIVSEIAALPFFSGVNRLNKGSVSSLIGTGLTDRLQEQELKTIICMGDCTDLCLYHLAVGLRYFANQHQLDWEIVVPADLVATYDLPVSVAKEIGALPHPGKLMHDLFLYHMELNGVSVVKNLSFP